MSRPVIGSNCEYQTAFARRYPHPISVEEKRPQLFRSAALIGAILFALAAVAAAIFVR